MCVAVGQLNTRVKDLENAVAKLRQKERDLNATLTVEGFFDRPRYITSDLFMRLATYGHDTHLKKMTRP